MTALCIAASLFFLLLTDPKPTEDALNNRESALDFSGSSKNDPVVEIEENNSICKDIHDTAVLLFSKKMLKLVPLMGWTAFSLAIYASAFVPMFTDMMDKTPAYEDLSPTQKNKNCLLALVGLGCGSVAGSMTMGRINDKYGNQVTAWLSLFELVLAGIALIAFTCFFRFSLWAAALVTFLWGIQDGSANCFVNGLLGFEFESKTTPFSVFKAV